MLDCKIAGATVVATDGGVFTYGDAVFRGSALSVRPKKSIAGLVR